MNKIIVVGHPQSGFEKVNELLQAYGMAKANISRREGFTPDQIDVTLVKAHGALPVQYVSKADELQQIEVAPIWQGLALDLMLANTEQSLWGWADAQAVYLLDYWKSQDPQTIFVLVYAEPQSAITLQNKLDTDCEALKARINGWHAYNAALLNFHLRNTHRSFLVHVEQVQSSVTSFVQQFSDCMNIGLHLAGMGKKTENPNLRSLREINVLPDGNVELDNSLFTQTVAGEPRVNFLSNSLAEWLALQLLEDFPDAVDLYSQMQASASMPRFAQSSIHTSFAYETKSQIRFDAWSDFVVQQAAIQQSNERLKILDKELLSKQEKIEQKQVQLDELLKTRDSAEQRLNEQEIKLRNNVDALQSSHQENGLLLEQLYKVQAELENLNLEKKRYLKDLTLAKEEKQEIGESRFSVGKKIKANLDTKDLKEENELLFNQLHKVQEELERYVIASNQNKKSKLVKNNYYGAADRVKQQLSYRLGSTMISHSRSLGGWLNLPFALRAEAKSFKADQVERQKVKLPPISQYADADEAEKIKKHLSYRLGARMISNSKSLSGLISLPWALHSEVKTFRKERSKH